MRVLVAFSIAVATVLCGFLVVPPLASIAVPAAGGQASATGILVGLLLMLLPFALAGSVLGSSDSEDPYRLALLFSLVPSAILVLVVAYFGLYRADQPLGAQVREMIRSNGWFGIFVSVMMQYLLAAIAACAGVWIARTIRTAGRSRMAASG